MTYLLVVDKGGSLTPNEIEHFLNARDDIADWLLCMDGVYVIKSTIDSSHTFFSALETYMKKNGDHEDPLYLVAPIERGNAWGWLPTKAWDLMTPDAGDDDGEIPF